MSSQGREIERFGEHDVGGKECLQDVEVSLLDTHTADSAWETRTHALLKLLEAKLLLNLHQLRRGVEALDGDRYRRLGYYERWILSIHSNLISSGVIAQRELDDFLGDVPSASATASPAQETPRFSVGQRVRVRREDILRTRWRRPHLRVPGYVFGCEGEVVEMLGSFEDPDCAALSPSLDYLPSQPNYRVRFRHADLWEIAARSHSEDSIDVEIAENWLAAPDDLVHAWQPFIHENPHGHQHSYAHPATHHKRHQHQNDHGDEAGSHAHSQAHSHDHAEDRFHSHDHSHSDEHDHVHEQRELVEQRAVDKEGPSSPFEVLSWALIQCLQHKGVITAGELAQYVEAIERVSGAEILGGAKVVARAWVDAEFRERLQRDGNKACEELGVLAGSPHNPVIKCMFNDEHAHNLVVCTLCSCYPLALLGRAPQWYKSRAYRARAVRDPRRLLAEFGTDVGSRAIRVHDSCSELRYLVIPQRPANTDGWTEEQLQRIITRDSMIGTRVLPIAID